MARGRDVEISIIRVALTGKEWADKMQSIGLIPSSSGEPGGKRTGDKMADFPAEDGKFLQA